MLHSLAQSLHVLHLAVQRANMWLKSVIVVTTWPADSLAVLRFTHAFFVQENLKLEQENQRVITMLAASAKSENRGVIKDILSNLERLKRDKAKVCIRIHVDQNTVLPALLTSGYNG